MDIVSNDWVDLFISNSLLINNRKLSRKLEGILKEGKFETIDYINDVLVESVDVEEEIQKESEAISINLDFSEYIKNYIDSQKWESDKIKEGILSEFGDIINIYNDSNKKI